MHTRILLIALTLSGVMMIGLQIRFKPHPTADEINTSARQFIEPRLWRVCSTNSSYHFSSSATEKRSFGRLCISGK